MSAVKIQFLIIKFFFNLNLFTFRSPNLGETRISQVGWGQGRRAQQAAMIFFFFFHYRFQKVPPTQKHFDPNRETRTEAPPMDLPMNNNKQFRNVRIEEDIQPSQHF